MKRRAPTPALSRISALALLAFAMAGCRIIPEGAGPPPSTPAQMPAPAYQPPYQAQTPPPAAPPPPEPAYTPAAEMPAATPAAPYPTAPYKGPPLAYTRIGETIYVDGPKVTPLSLIEDSRCPQNVQCVRAGQVKLRVRVDLGSGSHKIDMVMGQPVQVADGTLELRDALPGPVAGVKPAPFAYQFGFRFMGGI